ncbi:inositol monophosphatase family protein [Pseudoponticoccus marisrubri]|uniref:Inositol-1-monophosphatase n=1 Tax=Pseudoponticoccus marisrubri TaxID=1685382 RepID=A0A0W7WHA6_9RHOB|nr:inositol monophosphatase [Pseudoponticoccus marisrubri]KUF09994.1 hypothetical protein AVJ23_14715 [Pseudoponticoccus marisrubri]
MTPDRILDFAAELAEEAGRLAQALRKDAPADFVSAKGEMDFVTAADRTVESLIRQRIAAAFPGETVLGEEEGGAASELFWVVDPIDGTTNYLKGLPDWGVSIARVEGGKITHGVTACPDLALLAQAVRGGGAFLGGVPMAAVLDHPVAIVQLGYSTRTDLARHLDQLKWIMSQGADYRRSGAACIGLLNVAAGRSDAYYERHLNLWDAAAGLLLVSEAGGTCMHDDLLRFAREGSEVLALGASAWVDRVDWTAFRAGDDRT